MIITVGEEFCSGFCFLGRLLRWGKNFAVASSSLSWLLLLLRSTRGCCSKDCVGVLQLRL